MKTKSKSKWKPFDPKDKTTFPPKNQSYWVGIYMFGLIAKSKSIWNGAYWNLHWVSYYYDGDIDDNLPKLPDKPWFSDKNIMGVHLD